MDIPKRNKNGDYIIIVTTIIYIIFHIFSRPFESPLIYHCLFLLPFLTIFWISVKAYREKYFPARFFILGNTFILLGYLFRFLKDRGLLDAILYEQNTLLLISIYSRNISLVLDIIVLSLALAERIRYNRNEEMKAKLNYISQLEINEKLKDKVNQELEEKVKERTSELEKNAICLDELNKKLKKKSDENEKMNAILDKNNYDLVKEVSKTKKEKVITSDSSFKEFLDLFPTDLSVESYIETLKSDITFSCKKCNNSTFKNGPIPFSKQCLNCAKEELNSADTIFHRIRFPMNMALYIIYKVEKEGESLSVTHLSNEINLRRNTVSDFKGKILEVIQQLKSKKIKPSLNSIILSNKSF